MGLNYSPTVERATANFIREGMSLDDTINLVKFVSTFSRDHLAHHVEGRLVPASEAIKILRGLGRLEWLDTAIILLEKGITQKEAIDAVTGGPNSSMMAELIGNGIIDIKDQNEIKAAQLIGVPGAAEPEFIKDHDNPYYNLHNLVTKHDWGGEPFNPFEYPTEEMDPWVEKSSPSPTHVNYLWNQEPRSLDALHERFRGLSPEEQTSLTKSHIMTAKIAAQAIFSSNPLEVDQDFRIEHLLTIQNLANHLDVLADEIPQSEEEDPKELHKQAAALRMWAAVAKTKMSPAHS